MRCILRKETDPYFNLAAEEYLFKNSSEDTFMLWRNDPSVIIGKHQNTFAEINHEFVRKNGIHVVRRISGGGAVYHDHGNLNFTFISKADPQNIVDFNKYTMPICNAISKLGVNLVQGKRNSLYVGDMKISGNAEHVYKDSVIHHGTILFNSDLENLNNAILPAAIHYHDKAVKSIRSKVTNLNKYLPEDMNLEKFTDYIFSGMLAGNHSAYKSTLSLNDNIEIQKLVDEKYSTWEWNYGYSPPFSFQTRFNINEDSFTGVVNVRNGIIDSITTDHIEDIQPDSLKLVNRLIQVKLSASIVIELLRKECPDSVLKSLIDSLFVGENAEHLINLNV